MNKHFQPAHLKPDPFTDKSIRFSQHILDGHKATCFKAQRSRFEASWARQKERGEASGIVQGLLLHSYISSNIKMYVIIFIKACGVKSLEISRCSKLNRNKTVFEFLKSSSCSFWILEQSK